VDIITPFQKHLGAFEWFLEKFVITMLHGITTC